MKVRFFKMTNNVKAFVFACYCEVWEDKSE
jgi:hypothetical protein